MGILEQGAVGLILTIAFLVSIVVYACRNLASSSRYFMTIAVAFVPTCILGILYNTSIQVECCYMIALLCSIPYIANKHQTQERKDE